ncbi:S8 family peptidase [Fonticella tunisiensis]|uniref:Serine protease AprX n=1 Tax=Fonticella tunisiensis TaxID=1096341 RepID=A0A4R7KRN0_9CLOT|nr:S8 family peptidase [Fonticella tunisiensis]TDT61354.1 serine protease AprX [Fonticella tunisiensis]
MIFQEVSWIRINSQKFCPALRKIALEWYRSFRHVPCFMQNFFKWLKQRYKKYNVIVQVEKNHASAFSIMSLASSTGCRIEKELPLINSFRTRVNAKKLRKLAENRGVKKIWLDGEVHAVLDTASSVIKSSTLWKSGITGKGITVAVLDSGVYNHPDLKGRIIGFVDFIKNKKTAYDDNGHGTHVAGNIASSGKSSNYKYRGTAPEANIVGVKILNKEGSGSFSTVIEGIQWCIDNKDLLNIRVMNLSLGSPPMQSYKDDPVCQAVESAWKAGIVVCAAAGNSGPEPNTINSPGIDPLIITVGALNDNNTIPAFDDVIADFSSRGPTIDNLQKPDIVAPGVDIISLRVPGSLIDKQNKSARVGNLYTSLSGTSMATPICTGVVCQMLQANPSLTPGEVKERLIKTAIPVSGVDKNSQGAGIINAEEAVK